MVASMLLGVGLLLAPPPPPTEGEGEGEGEGYTLKLEFVADGGSVTETLTDPDCAVVVDAAVDSWPYPG